MQVLKKQDMLTCIEETQCQLLNNIENNLQLTESLVTHYKKGNYNNICLIASGSSHNACECALPYMIKYINSNVTLITPTALLYGYKILNSNTLYIVVSQSGCSTNAIEACKYIKRNNYNCIGLCANLNSDLPKHTDICIDYGVGVETVSFVTKGVTTLILFLQMFATRVALENGIIDGDKFNKLFEQFKSAAKLNSRLKDESIEFFNQNKNTLLNTKYFCFMGFDQAEGIANEACLKFVETVKIPTMSYDAEEFNHGPVHQVTSGYTLFFIDDLNLGSRRLNQLYKASKKLECPTYLITSKKKACNNVICVHDTIPEEPLMSPIYIIAFFQTLSYLIAEESNSWQTYQSVLDFRSYAPSKTESIKLIMQ